MKANVWLWSIISTLVCVSQFVTSAHRDYQDIQLLNALQLPQDDYPLGKRTKPSLSIVNPLHVLRQRLLLEIARRQMKENTKQVEINREILQTVGKRDENKNNFDYLDAVQNNDKNYTPKGSNVNEQNDEYNRIRYLYSLYKNRYMNK